MLGGTEQHLPPSAQRMHGQRIGLGRAGAKNHILGAGRRKTAATVSRASSSTRRAARPAGWMEDGLPSAIAARAASRASGRNGSVALASR